ncbi:FMN reductase, partial [bacterium M00.F.Ca.ET.163.01.1.1]
GFFEALALPTAVYATDKDFADGVLVSEAIRKRAAQAIEEAGYALLRRAASRQVAAE